MAAPGIPPENMSEEAKPFLVSDLIRQLEAEEKQQQPPAYRKPRQPKDTVPVRVVSFRGRSGSKVLPMAHRTFHKP